MPPPPPRGPAPWRRVVPPPPPPRGPVPLVQLPGVFVPVTDPWAHIPILTAPVSESEDEMGFDTSSASTDTPPGDDSECESEGSWATYVSTASEVTPVPNEPLPDFLAKQSWILSEMVAHAVRETRLKGTRWLQDTLTRLTAGHWNARGLLSAAEAQIASSTCHEWGAWFCFRYSHLRPALRRVVERPALEEACCEEAEPEPLFIIHNSFDGRYSRLSDGSLLWHHR